jgi:hypothetical protein
MPNARTGSMPIAAKFSLHEPATDRILLILVVVLGLELNHSGPSTTTR